MKILLTFLALTMSLSTSFASRPDKVYTLMTYDGTAKTEIYKDGADFVESALKASGLKVHTVEVPIMRGLQLVDTEQADFFMAASTSVQAHFKNLIHPPTPFVKTSVWVFYNKASDNFKNKVPIEQLQGVIWLNAFYLVRDSVQWLKLSGVSTVEQGLQMVQNKRADYTLADKHLIQEVIDRDPSKYADIAMREVPLFDMELYLWTNPKNKAMLPLIERKQKEALLSGEMSKYKHLHPLLNTNP